VSIKSVRNPIGQSFRSVPGILLRANAAAAASRATLACPSVSSTIEGVGPDDRPARRAGARRRCRLPAALCRRRAIRKTAPGAQQRARRGQRELGRAAAKHDHGHFIAPDIALGQQQFDGALASDNRCSALEPDASRANTVTVCSRCRRRSAKILRPYQHPRSRSVVASRLRRRCHGTAARSVSMRLSAGHRAGDRRARRPAGRAHVRSAARRPGPPNWHCDVGRGIRERGCQ